MARLEEFDDVQLDVEFTQAGSRSNLTSKENIAISFGKIAKWYEALVPTGGSSGQFLGFNSSGTAKWVSNPNTDQKVKATKLAQSTADASYYPTLVAGEGTAGVSIFDSAKINHTKGTTSAVGNTRLILGNATNEGTTNNEEGLLRIYSPGTKYHTLKGAKITTDNVEHTLPTTGGTILNTGTTSFTQTLSSGTKIGTIKINGTSSDIYAPTNTDTKVTDTVGTANTYYPAGGTSTSTATGTQVFDTSFKFIGTTGTTSAVGKAQLVLGNSIASGTANNKQGSIVVYGSTAYAHTIQGAPTAARTLTLPDKTGTFALTSDIPSVPTVNDAALTLKGAGTTVTTFTANASSAKSLDIVAGSNVTVTADATNAKISIASSHPTITKSTDTTSTASPAHGGTFTVVDSITREANGHVTKINTKTVTLPADSNTDTKVTQSATTTTNYRPILFGAKNSTDVSTLADTITDQAYTSTKMFAKPNTGILYASGFSTSSFINGTGAQLNQYGLYLKSYKSASLPAGGNYSYAEYAIRVYDGKSIDNNGMLLTIDGGGLTIVGGGESAKSLAALISDDQRDSNTSRTRLDVGGTLNTAYHGSEEQLILSSDNNIYFLTTCQTIANRKPVVLDVNSYFYPGTTKTGSIGTSSYMWNSVYAATIYENGTSLASKYAAIGHTHTTTIAADSGTNQLTLAASTKYKLTAGGTNFIFTTPPNTTYSAGTGLSLSGTTFNHSNSITAVTSAVFKKITYDAQGHITGTANVTASDLPSHTHSYLPLSGTTINNPNTSSVSFTNGMTGNILFTNTGGTNGVARGIGGIVGASDSWSVRGYQTGDNKGCLEIAVGDDGDEGIYVRQYTSGAYKATFSNNAGSASGLTYRELVLMAPSTGASTFPSDVTLSGGRLYLSGSPGNYGQLNLKSASYNVMFRNDNANTYILLTAQGDPDGAWTSARPLTINNSTGICSINGNAATATSWATARTLTLSGQLTGSVSVKGDANMTLSGWLKKSLIYDETSDFASYAWHKFAEKTITAKNEDQTITFIVSKTWGNVPSYSGILTAHIRTGSTKVYESSQFYWQLANTDIDPENFVFVYTNTADTNCKVELWYKQTTRYDGWIFTVLKEHSRTSNNNVWTLYTSTGHGSASHTTGTASYASSIVGIKNNTSGTSSNVTGTVAIANGGTGATTRLAALKALTNENVGTNAQYFLTITQDWGKGGFSSVANVKTVLGLKSAAYTESSDYLSSTTKYAGSSSAGGAANSANVLNYNNSVTATTSGLQYTHGGITIGTADGNSKEGSDPSYKLWSYPAGGTATNSTSANIQNLRLYWSTAYFRDIFLSPNNDRIYHRAVINNSAKPWYVLLDSNNLETYSLHTPDTAKALSTGTGQDMSPITRPQNLHNRSNKLALIPGSNITVEYSTDAGSNWTDMGLTADKKGDLFNDTISATIPIGPNNSTDRTTSMQTRITITCDGRDQMIDQYILWLDSAYQTISIDLQVAYGNATTTFTNIRTGLSCPPWIYQYILNTETKRFGTNKTSAYVNKIRFIIKYTSINSSYKTSRAIIHSIAGYSGIYWGGTAKNNLMIYDHLYTWDNSQNATFPAQLNATGATFTSSSYGALSIKRTSANNAGIKFYNNGSTYLGSLAIDTVNGTFHRFKTDDSTMYEIIDRSVVSSTPSAKVDTNWDTTADRTTVVTKGWMAYWNGAYNGTTSNLTYCNQGAFGTIVTKSATDYSKVTSSTTNGKIKIDGTDTTVYTHPSHTSKTSGLYKITVDSLGHVSATASVAKGDIPTLDYLPLAGGTMTGDIEYPGAGNRKIALGQNNFKYYVASTSDWAGGLIYFSNDGSTVLGAFGAYGQTNALKYHYIGGTYNAPQIKIEPTGPNLIINSEDASTPMITLFRKGSNKADWRIVNTSGNLKFQSDYTTAVGDWYDALTVECNTGNITMKTNATFTFGKFASATDDANRHVFFKDNSANRICVNDNFKYNPSTNILTVGSITGSATNVAIARVTKDSKVFPGSNKVVFEEYTNGTSYNLPSNHYYHIMSAQGSDTKFGTQLALGMTTTAAYYRSYNNKTWSAWKSIINSDTYDRNRYNANIKAGSSALVAANIIVGKDGVYHHLKSGGAFDITYPILYLAGAVDANGTTSNTYDIIHFTITTTQSITLAAYRPVYIKGTLNGTVFTPVNTTPLIQTIQTSGTTYDYIYLGQATSSTTVYLQERHPIYSYRNGRVQEITPCASMAVTSDGFIAPMIKKLYDDSTTSTNYITISDVNINDYEFFIICVTDAPKTSWESVATQWIPAREGNHHFMINNGAGPGQGGGYIRFTDGSVYIAKTGTDNKDLRFTLCRPDEGIKSSGSSVTTDNFPNTRIMRVYGVKAF